MGGFRLRVASRRSSDVQLHAPPSNRSRRRLPGLLGRRSVAPFTTERGGGSDRNCGGAQMHAALVDGVLSLDWSAKGGAVGGGDGRWRQSVAGSYPPLAVGNLVRLLAERHPLQHARTKQI